MRDIIDNLNTSETKEIIVYKSTSQGPTISTELWGSLFIDIALKKIKRLIAHKCMVTTVELMTEYNGFLTGFER